MKKMIQTLIVASAVMVVSLLMAMPSSVFADVGLISKEELKSSLYDGNLVILDVRTGRDWSSSEFKIKGALRAAAGDIEKWSSTLDKGNKVVLYCA